MVSPNISLYVRETGSFPKINFKFHLQCIQHKVTSLLAPEVKLADHVNLAWRLGMYGALPQHTPCHHLLCFDKGRFSFHRILYSITTTDCAFSQTIK